MGGFDDDRVGRWVLEWVIKSRDVDDYKRSMSDRAAQTRNDIDVRGCVERLSLGARDNFIIEKMLTRMIMKGIIVPK